MARDGAMIWLALFIGQLLLCSGSVPSANEDLKRLGMETAYDASDFSAIEAPFTVQNDVWVGNSRPIYKLPGAGQVDYAFVLPPFVDTDSREPLQQVPVYLWLQVFCSPSNDSATAGQGPRSMVKNSAAAAQSVKEDCSLLVESQGHGLVVWQLKPSFQPTWQRFPEPFLVQVPPNPAAPETYITLRGRSNKVLLRRIFLGRKTPVPVSPPPHPSSAHHAPSNANLPPVLSGSGVSGQVQQMERVGADKRTSDAREAPPASVLSSHSPPDHPSAAPPTSSSPSPRADSMPSPASTFTPVTDSPPALRSRISMEGKPSLDSPAFPVSESQELNVNNINALLASMAPSAPSSAASKSADSFSKGHSPASVSNDSPSAPMLSASASPLSPSSSSAPLLSSPTSASSSPSFPKVLLVRLEVSGQNNVDMRTNQGPSNPAMRGSISAAEGGQGVVYVKGVGAINTKLWHKVELPAQLFTSSASPSVTLLTSFVLQKLRLDSSIPAFLTFFDPQVNEIVSLDDLSDLATLPSPPRLILNINPVAKSSELPNVPSIPNAPNFASINPQLMPSLGIPFSLYPNALPSTVPSSASTPNVYAPVNSLPAPNVEALFQTLGQIGNIQQQQIQQQNSQPAAMSGLDPRFLSFLSQASPAPASSALDVSGLLEMLLRSRKS